MKESGGGTGEKQTIHFSNKNLHVDVCVSFCSVVLGGIRSGPGMPESDAFAILAGNLGIDNDTTVVVYDETGPMAGITPSLDMVRSKEQVMELY